MTVIDHAIITGSYSQKDIDIFKQAGEGLTAYYLEYALIPLELLWIAEKINAIAQGGE